MTNILELLKNEKVEWKKLGEVADIQRGRVISKKYLEEHRGEFPVYSSQTQNDGVIGRIDTYDFDGEYITWTTDGAYAGTVFYRLGKFSITNICGLIKPKDELLIKYVFYWLQIEAKKYVASGSGNPKLMSNVVAKIKIPIPTLEIQGKIVNILDKLTNYIFELQLELQSRTKQYTYYRDRLLSEEYLNNVTKEMEEDRKLSLVKLEEVVTIKNGKDWKKLGQGNIPVYGSGGEMGILVDKYSYDKPTVLIPRKESIDNVFYLDKPFWNVDTIFHTEIDESKLIPKYFYYFIEHYNLKKLSDNSTRPSLTQSTLNKLKLPLPSLSLQNKIVKVLDKFQVLLADTKGLLAEEIEQRQKQYEYYREKLLTFGVECDSTHARTVVVTNNYYDILQEAVNIVEIEIDDRVEELILGDIGKISMCKRILKNQTISEGDIPFYKIGTFGKRADAYISRDLFEEYKGKYSYPKKGEILLSASGTIGRTIIFNGEDSYYQDSNIVWLSHDEDKILNSYLYYCYQIINWNPSTGGTIKRLYNYNLININIVVPPLHVQQHVVAILDKFDTLVNDIKEGLPKEIEQRQKQYEYWRERLLNFPR